MHCELVSNNCWLLQLVFSARRVLLTVIFMLRLSGCRRISLDSTNETRFSFAACNWVIHTIPFALTYPLSTYHSLPSCLAGSISKGTFSEFHKIVGSYRVAANTRVCVARCIIFFLSMSWFGKFNGIRWATWRENQRKKRQQESCCKKILHETPLAETMVSL